MKHLNEIQVNMNKIVQSSELQQIALDILRYLLFTKNETSLNFESELAKFRHQLQNNQLPKLFQELFCKINTVHDHNTRHVSKNAYFRPRVKKCITQTLLAFRRSKLGTNIDDVYENKEYRYL